MEILNLGHTKRRSTLGSDPFVVSIFQCDRYFEMPTMEKLSIFLCGLKICWLDFLFRKCQWCQNLFWTNPNPLYVFTIFYELALNVRSIPNLRFRALKNMIKYFLLLFWLMPVRSTTFWKGAVADSVFCLVESERCDERGPFAKIQCVQSLTALSLTKKRTASVACFIAQLILLPHDLNDSK